MLDMGIGSITQFIPLVPVAHGICDLAYCRACMRSGGAATIDHCRTDEHHESPQFFEPQVLYTILPKAEIGLLVINPRMGVCSFPTRVLVTAVDPCSWKTSR